MFFGFGRKKEEITEVTSEESIPTIKETVETPVLTIEEQIEESINEITSIADQLVEVRRNFIYQRLADIKREHDENIKNVNNGVRLVFYRDNGINSAMLMNLAKLLITAKENHRDINNRIEEGNSYSKKLNNNP